MSAQARRDWAMLAAFAVAVAIIASLIVAGSLGARSGTSVVAGPPEPRTVSAAFFGMQQEGLAQKPLPIKATSIRLWGTGASWREVQPTARGQFDWAPLDAAIRNARKAGAADLLYVLGGSTPLWAARSDAPGLFGPGSASPAKHEQDYLDFVRAVTTRYKGVINGYQVWNEAGLPIFYTGSPEDLAKLTGKVTRLVRSIDPRAAVATAGLVAADTPAQTSPGSWNDKYLTALTGGREPFDVVSVTMYPQTGQGPADHLRNGAAVEQMLDRFAIAKPIYEMEVNYGAPFSPRIPEPAASALVARSYIDALQMGLDRSYWYAYNLAILGVFMEDNGQPTRSATAFETIRAWLSGQQWHGCSLNSGGSQSCLVTTPSGDRAGMLAFRDRGVSLVTAPGWATRICRLDGTCVPILRNQPTMITESPVLFSAS